MCARNATRPLACQLTAANSCRWASVTCTCIIGSRLLPSRRPPEACHTLDYVLSDSMPGLLRLTPEPTARRQAAHVLSIEARCRKVLAKHGSISKRQLARLVGCSDSTAARWKRVVAREQAEAAEYAN